MMERILKAPINYFFEKVPIGRLINRLSKDLAVLDNYIALSFSGTLLNWFAFFADLFVSIYFGSIYIAPISILFLIAGIYFRRRYMAVNRETIRLGKLLRGIWFVKVKN